MGRSNDVVTIKLRVLDGEIMVRRTRILNQSGLPTGRESEELLSSIQLEGMLSCEIDGIVDCSLYVLIRVSFCFLLVWGSFAR